jgi:hypothetical protein
MTDLMLWVRECELRGGAKEMRQLWGKYLAWAEEEVEA